MAKIEYCGKTNNATEYKLPSDINVYEFQLVYVIKHCRECKQQHMTWKGQYPSGNFSSMVDIPIDSFWLWQRRIDAGEAIPEAQLMSEWSEKAARPADLAIYYHNTIKVAQMGKGKRVKHQGCQCPDCKP